MSDSPLHAKHGDYPAGVTRSPDDLATLRGVLGQIVGIDARPPTAAMAALDRIEARVQELEREREEFKRWQNAYAKGRAGLVQQADQDFARAEAAEARVQELEQAIGDLNDAVHNERARVETLTQENERLREALREYGAKPGGLLRIITAKDDAEAALADMRRALELLRRIRQWDALNPPPDPVPAPFGDLPYWIAEIDRALATADSGLGRDEYGGAFQGEAP